MSGNGICWAICKSAPHPQIDNHASISPLSFYRPDAFPATQPTASKHWRRSSIIPICFLHLLRSMASSLFKIHAWQSFHTISVQPFFGLPLCLAPSTSYSIHFFAQSLSSFCSTCPYHCNLFCCSTKIISSNPSLSLSSLLGTLSSSHYVIMFSISWYTDAQCQCIKSKHCKWVTYCPVSK